LLPLEDLTEDDLGNIRDFLGGYGNIQIDLAQGARLDAAMGIWVSPKQCAGI
jgi:hypothetical protein